MQLSKLPRWDLYDDGNYYEDVPEGSLFAEHAVCLLYQYCSKDDYNAFYEKHEIVHEQETVWSKLQTYLAGARNIACLYYLLYSDRNGVLTIPKQTFQKKVYDAFHELYCYEHFFDKNNKLNTYGRLFTKKLADTILEGVPSEKIRWDKYSKEIEEKLLKLVQRILDKENIDLNKQPFILHSFPRTVIAAVISGLRISCYPPDGCNLSFATDKVISSILLRIRDEMEPPPEDNDVPGDDGEFPPTSLPTPPEVQNSGVHTPTNTITVVNEANRTNAGGALDEAVTPSHVDKPAVNKANVNEPVAPSNRTIVAQAIVDFWKILRGKRDGKENEKSNLEDDKSTNMELQDQPAPTVTAADGCREETSKESDQMPAALANAFNGLMELYETNSELFARIAVEIEDGIKKTQETDSSLTPFPINEVLRDKIFKQLALVVGTDRCQLELYVPNEILTLTDEEEKQWNDKKKAAAEYAVECTIENMSVDNCEEVKKELTHFYACLTENLVFDMGMRAGYGNNSNKCLCPCW